MKKILLLTAAAMTFMASCGDSDENTSEGTAEQTVTGRDTVREVVHSGEGVRIAFIDNEILGQKYVKLKKLEQSYVEKQKEIQMKLQQLQADLVAYSQKAQEGFELLPKSEQEKILREMERRQLNAQQQQERLQGELMEFETKMLSTHIKEVMTAAETYAKDHGYDFVLVKEAGQGLLYGNASYDITEPVVEMLNEQYRSMTGDTSGAGE